MTVTNTTNTVEEAGNDTKTAFTFDFKAFAAGDLKIFKVDTTTLVATEQTITTDYTVSLNTTTEGGTITYVVAPTTSQNSFIKREMTIDQQTDVPTEGNIPETSLNNEYDKSRMIDIQQQDELDRSIKFAETSSLSDIDFPESTSASARANKIVGYDAAGTGLELTAVSTIVNTDPIAVQGDLVQGNSAGAAEKLAIGSVEDILQIVAGKAAWVNPTGTGIPVLTTSPTIVTPTIADLVNMNHTHLTAAQGGTLVGRSVQVVNVQSGAVATGTTVMIDDDSIPQNDEGDEYITLAITPKNTNNKLKIEVQANIANSTNNKGFMALFQDSTADALAATGSHSAGTNVIIPFVLTHYMTAGTTSATTFKVRVGTTTAGTITFNGAGGARKLGDVMASSITITEIQV